MKTMIVLEATANQGKSNTLRYLEKDLNSEKINSKLREGALDKGDFVITFDKCCKSVAIVTQGDNEKLKNRLIELYDDIDINMDILFCASRTKGATIKVIESIAETYDVKVIWSTTYKYNTSKKDEVTKKELDKLNELKAKHLKDLALEIKLF